MIIDNWRRGDLNPIAQTLFPPKPPTFCALRGANSITRPALDIYIYIYIVCVCVCVCPQNIGKENNQP